MRHWLGFASEFGVKKSDVLELLQQQPEDLDMDKFIYTLWVRRKIERALAEAENDEGMPHEEFVRQTEKWLE